ncbi:unnamed protein product [Lactuca saligna]|uniref:glutathione gamma-glutamylcysteinyltransferase n=1 Tax=Lactuca saligna TaxID=75948 RepID=A0AA36E9R4_LACSI|nr:unnamed protein product [Lactuca saligna]
MVLSPPPLPSAAVGIFKSICFISQCWNSQSAKPNTHVMLLQAHLKWRCDSYIFRLYRRVLPSPPAIDFASPEGKQLFIEAIQGGTMEGFFKLISYFQTQSEPAYCGLATLAMVLNALSIDPGRKWKVLLQVLGDGLMSLCWIAVSLWKRHVIACSTSDDCHLISSYNRGTFKQTGSGHFSPIGGYHAGRDMVLVLDVARFKYPPHWVPLTLLWEAMDTIDDSSGFRRGFMLISRLHRSPALLYTLSCKHESWIKIAEYLVEDVPKLLSCKDVKDVKDVVAIVFNSLPSNFLEFIKWVAEVRRREDAGQTLSPEEKERLDVKEEILKQVQEIRLHKHVTDFLFTGKSREKESPCLCKESCLTDIADSLCCQGAVFLEGNSNGYCCQKTCVKTKSNGDVAVTVVSGTVTNGIEVQQVEVLVPSSLEMHPATNDVLTVLLLALPPQTWFGIKDEKLLKDISSLVSIDSLPTLLQEEIMHLRGQLYILKRCKDEETEEDFGAPLV